MPAHPDRLWFMVYHRSVFGTVVLLRETNAKHIARLLHSKRISIYWDKTLY